MRLLLAILMLSSAQFGTQLFLPALPDIAAHFQLSDASTQQIIMLYFISFGLSQLFYGPWVDAVGPRKVFYTGQTVFFIGSLLCYLAYSPNMLALGRILQGLGAGAPLILSRVILSKSLDGDKLTRALGSLAVAASVVSVVSPLIGGFLTTAFSWQFAFFIFTTYLLVVGIAGAMLLPPVKHQGPSLSVVGTLKDYAGLLANKKFFTAASFKWLPTLMFLSSGTFLPFELQNRFDLTAEQYGSYMMLPLCGLILGTSLAKVVQRYYPAQMIIALFWPLFVVSALIFQFYPTTLMSTLIAFSVFMVASGTYYSSCLQLIMAPFKDKAGTASALMGSIDMFVFSMLAAAVNRYWVTDIQSLGTLFLTCSVLIAVNWLVMQYGETKVVPGAGKAEAELG